MTENVTEKNTLAKSIGERAISAGLGGIIAAILISASVAIGDSITHGWLIDKLGGVPQSEFDPSQLKNAVLAFDTPDGCPAGWVELMDSEGRVLVGEGPRYSYQKRGGTEEIVLDDSHMPSHAHKHWDVFFSETDDNPRPEGIRMYPVPGGFGQKGPRDQNNMGWAFPHSTESSGEGASHTNMQPYIALYFCKFLVE